MLDLLDAEQLAALLHVHIETIARRLRTQPDFPRPMVSGRKRLWLRSEVEAYLRMCRAE